MKKLMTLCIAVLFLSSCTTLKESQWINEEILKVRRQAVVEVLSNTQIKGTGAIISEDGLVLTASHLFTDDKVEVEIITADEVRRPAKLIRRNRCADLALVKITADKNDKFPFFPIAKEMPKQGEFTGCFGAALWNPVMLLKGQIANPAPNYCEYPSANGYMRCTFASAAIPGLASGGPWINSQGEIFGVQAGHLLDGGKDAGITMIGALDDINALLTAKKSIHTAGIQAWVWPLWTTDKGIIDAYPKGTNGLLVNSFHPNSCLEKAGIKAHELIVSCDNKITNRRHDLLGYIKSKKPGDNVEMEIMSKSGKTRKVTVTLGDTETGTL